MWKLQSTNHPFLKQMSQCLIKKIEDPTLQTDNVQQIIERICFILPQIKRKYSTKQQ